MELPKVKTRAEVDPIFGQYDIVDSAVKQLIKQIPVNHDEVYYLMELHKQEQVMAVLMAAMACIIALTITFNLM